MERLALLVVLVLAPHTKVPAVGFVYPFRPSDIFLVAAAIMYIRLNFKSGRLLVALPEMLVAFFISVVSIFWGDYLLNMENLGAVIDSGVQVSYLSVAIKKIILIFICFIGFQFLISSRAITNVLILKCWRTGLCLAVIIHAMCYVVTSDYFLVRAGVFVEGNHGGSYYLLSFFLMWYAKQKKMYFGVGGMLLSFCGVILSQSTTSLLLLLPLSIATFFSLPAHERKKVLGGIEMLLVALVIFGILMVFGDEILAKLIGEEIDPSSFSRYDRISSIISGIDMFLAHPFFGVGLQGYAFALPRFVDPFIDGFFDWNSRRIANNIYVELLAEQGIIGLLAMILVVYRICRPTFRRFRQQPMLAAGSVSILLSWFAFPTYTISFHWIGWAVLVRLAVQGVDVPVIGLCAVNSSGCSARDIDKSTADLESVPPWK